MLAWCFDHIKPEERENWLFELEQPLPGQEKQVSDSDLQADADSFMALMASQQK